MEDAVVAYILMKAEDAAARGRAYVTVRAVEVAAAVWGKPEAGAAAAKAIRRLAARYRFLVLRTSDGKYVLQVDRVLETLSPGGGRGR